MADLTLQIVDNDHSLPMWSQLVVLVFGVGKFRRFANVDVKTRLPAIPDVYEALHPLLEAGFVETISDPENGECFQLVKGFSNPRKEQLRVRVGVVFMADGGLYDEDAFRAGIGYQDGRKVVSEMRKAGYPIEEERGDRSIISYRMTSVEPTGDVKHVTGIPTAKKRQLFSRDSYACVFCGHQFEEKELFPDHKLPANIAGDHVDFSDYDWMSDFQTVCRACNYNKREACKRCPNVSVVALCLECFWFDPKAKEGILITPDASTRDGLYRVSKDAGMPITEVAAEALRLYVRDLANRTK